MAGGHENLKPVKPGEVRNPKGINQFTYRHNAEKQFAERLARRFRKDVSVSEQIIRRVLQDARDGKPHAQKLVLERVLPAIQQHEVKLPTSELAKVQTEPPRLGEVTEILSESDTLH